MLDAQFGSKIMEGTRSLRRVKSRHPGLRVPANRLRSEASAFAMPKTDELAFKLAASPSRSLVGQLVSTNGAPGLRAKAGFAAGKSHLSWFQAGISG
jgi:hypothetical protein